MVNNTRYSSRLITQKIIIFSTVVCTLYLVHMASIMESEEIPEYTNAIITRKGQQTAAECHTELRYNSSLPLPRGGCQRLTPVSGSCLLAHQLFFSSPVDTCEPQLNNNICQITESFSADINIKCSDTICANQTVLLGEISDDTGVLEWQDFPSTSHLEDHLRRVFSNRTDHYGFYFIRCATYSYLDRVRRERNNIEYNVTRQLLVVPPFLNSTQPPRSGDHWDRMNVNIILIDSVSHSHFLRSLPTSLQILRRLRETTVFNFELFQSLKGNTYENLQALFSGELYKVDEPFEVHDMPLMPVKFERLLNGFKSQEYETLYTEDLCWERKWGLVRNMLAYMPGYDIKTRWNNFKMALEKAGIDRVDMTLSSCEILNDNNIEDPFFGPPTVCYNGQYQHHYILDYLSKRQKSLEANGWPFFHHTLLNVAHDNYGRRIQTLDKDLADYIKSVSKLNNTLTIILSDHGNTYGEYIKRSEEGRVEMFHPVLFMLVPHGVATTLGEWRMDALRTNQQRLVSILDIHYSLRYLSKGKLEQVDEEHRQYSIKPDGIFSEITPNRSCDDIPRIEPNICICQDYEDAAENDASYALLAEFALGTINNEIQRQYRKSNPDTQRGFGSCQRLVAHHFGNIKQRHNQNGDRDVKMDLYVANPDNPDSMEVFMGVLKVSGSADCIKLVAYERITRYRPFDQCASKSGVSAHLCVCSLDRIEIELKEVPNKYYYPQIFGSKTILKQVHRQCLIMFTRTNEGGVVMEAANQCINIKYVMYLYASTDNMVSSSQRPVKTELGPGMTSFLIVMVQADNSLNWDYKYKVNYEWTDVKIN